jgi:hypothetical protein
MYSPAVARQTVEQIGQAHLWMLCFVKLSPEYALSSQSPMTDCPTLPHQFHSSADSPNTRRNRFGFVFWDLNKKGFLLKFGVKKREIFAPDCTQTCLTEELPVKIFECCMYPEKKEKHRPINQSINQQTRN